MQNPFKIPLMKLGRTIVALKPVLIDAIGTEALNFIDDNFRDQGFHGATFQPWPLQIKPNKPRPHKILILTATLRRSFTKNDDSNGTTLQSDLPYARIHNDGGDIRHPYREVTLNYRKDKFGKLRLAKTGTINQQRQVKEIRRSSIYNHITTMPARPFIGPSPLLTQRCQGIIIKKVLNALK